MHTNSLMETKEIISVHEVFERFLNKYEYL